MNESVVWPNLLSIVVLGVHAIAIAIDEFYFHWKRGLARWERYGHPIDTLFFLLALGAIIQIETVGEPFAIAAAVLSSLVIIKDEFEHKKRSTGAENLLHALLFVLHPAVLYCCYLNRDQLSVGLLLPAAAFLVYQLGFWVILKKGKWPNGV